MPESLDTLGRAPRFDVALGVSLPGGDAVTRNVSSTGAYLRISSPITVGSDLSFSLAIPAADGTPMFNAPHAIEEPELV